MMVASCCTFAHTQAARSAIPAGHDDIRVDPDLLASSGPVTGLTTPPPGASGPTSSESVPNAAISATPATGPYAAVARAGLIFNLPPPSQTVDGDFALRRTLAQKYGIGYDAWSINTFYDNILRHDHHSPQYYNGQKPTGLTQNVINIVVDLGHYGIPDGQIAVGAVYQNDSWNPAGPTTLTLGNLTYYQTFLDKRLELKIGQYNGLAEFYGSFTGGSLGGGTFGPAGLLIQEAGLSIGGDPTYGVILTGHPTRHIYDKIELARSANPGGLVLEHNFNPTSTRFSTPNTGAFVLNELGYKAQSRPNGGSTWIRFGTALSGAHYMELDHAGLRSPDNYLVYLNADQQILHTSAKPRESYRGLYAGFSISYVPPNLNLFSQYYEARLYGLGILPHRPFDQVSLVFTNTVFSGIAYEAARAAHKLAHPDSRALTLSYSLSVHRGILLNAGIGYVNNPSPLTYTAQTGSALNGILGTAIFF